jgi:hypothetical protein
MNMAESSDHRVPSQGLTVYDEAREASAQGIRRWTTLKSGQLEELNRELKTKGLVPIAIAEIEREVYELMTR